MTGAPGDLEKEIARLRRGWRPSTEDLVDVPVIRGWSFGFRPGSRAALCLWGDVRGHPTFGDRAIYTSALVAIDEAAGWARTVNRYYRLIESVTS
ncbi:MAG: hypothetical protein RO009_23165 [Pseudorhodoplanes sp.]|jgi:hypothetical protein|nr:hypothetical protein [Pseudorhodoplanes sp.]